MAERPDSPIANTPEPPEPEDEQIVHHVSQRKKRKKGVGGEEMELNLTSMIDVIFQLLIYFVITANFMIHEGVIVATLPGDSVDIPNPDDLTPPMRIELTTADDGFTYTLTIDGKTVNGGAAGLYDELQSKLASTKKTTDPVQIAPDPRVRWQHVVNTYNACVRAEMEKVSFAP